MSNSLTAALVAGLGGMLGWGFADFFAKKTIDKIGDLPSLVWAHLFGTGFFVIIVAGLQGIQQRPAGRAKPNFCIVFRCSGINIGSISI
jgi:hypothetical protein